MDGGVPGPDFGPYRLVELLASSARASVHRAVDRRHDDRIVALKIFAPALSADPAFRARFRRDAAALSALREPHVVSVHTYGELAGALFLDMRLVTGRSLADLHRAGRLPAARAAAISSQISDALGAVEMGGLGRRSVEPAEVLVTGGPGNEFVQLVGLGLGRPPAEAAPVVADLLGAAGAGRPHRRRWWPAAAALVVVLALVGVVAISAQTRDRPPPPPGAVAVLDDSDGVTAAATAEVGGRMLVVGVLPDGKVRTWDIATGDIAGPDLDGPARFVETAVVDGAPVAVTRDDDQVVHVRRLPDGRAIVPALGDPEEPDPAARRSQGRAAVPAQLGGQPVVVLAEPADPATFRTITRYALRVRALADGAAIGPLVSVPGASLSQVPATAVLDGVPVVVTTSDEGGEDFIGTDEQRVLRLFDMASGAAVGSPVRLPAEVTQLRVAMRGGAPVAVLGCADNAVRVVDLRTGTLVGPVMTGHRGSVGGLLVIDVGPRTIVVSEAFAAGRGTASEIRFWDRATGAPVGPVLRDHPAGGGLLAATRLGDRPVLVAAEAADATGSGSAAVTVWDVAALLGENGT